MNDLIKRIQQSIQTKMVLPIVIGAALVPAVSLAILFRIKAENT